MSGIISGQYILQRPDTVTAMRKVVLPLVRPRIAYGGIRRAEILAVPYHRNSATMIERSA